MCVYKTFDVGADDIVIKVTFDFVEFIKFLRLKQIFLEVDEVVRGEGEVFNGLFEEI